MISSILRKSVRHREVSAIKHVRYREVPLYSHNKHFDVSVILFCKHLVISGKYGLDTSTKKMTIGSSSAHGLYQNQPFPVCAICLLLGKIFLIQCFK